jgi:acetylornithine deacetylase/succinyl-diaminopimelate desuccinylase-like protein
MTTTAEWPCPASICEVSGAVRQEWSDLRFDDAEFLEMVGLKQSAGEAGYSVLEQLWARPTLEINGIVGGYTAIGTKTVIPSQASAKISCRLVADQDPDRIRAILRDFIRQRLPAGVSVAFGEAGTASPAVHIRENHPSLTAAHRALKAEWQREPVFIGSGFSIPIVSSFQSVLGMDSLMIGFALNDDAAHSPNEKYNLTSLHKGIRSWIRVIDALAPGQR